ncbi:hypothetical protein OFC51_35010, partial [Escherichia coli]|nr:hypothetical protein [Escherichia coli]
LFKNNISIIDLFHIDEYYLSNLTTEILKYEIFNNVKLLNADYNENITDVSFLKSLKVLHAKWSCGIKQWSIEDLPLIVLN